MCRSIMISGAYNDSTGERCIAEKRNDLFGPEPATEPVTSCLGVCVPSTGSPGPDDASQGPSSATILLESFRTPTATLLRRIANWSRLARLRRRHQLCQG